MKRSARIALVQAPFFSAEAPSNALALLSAHLRRAGACASVHDASLGVRRSLEAGGLPGEDLFADDGEKARQMEAAAPERFQAALDAEVERVLEAGPDIVGFTVQMSTDRESLRMARRIKLLSPRTQVLFGGAQCLRETRAFELIEEPAVDAVALAEGDRSLVALALAARPGEPVPALQGFLTKDACGRVVDGGDPLEVEDLDTLPFMDFSGFDMAAYPGELSMTTSRGCVRECSFCTHILQQKGYRRMSADRIAAEVRHQLSAYPERGFISFGDSLINGDVALLGRMSDLFAELRRERAARGRPDFGWRAAAIIHPTLTPALLKRMRQGGCEMLAFGLESGSQAVVDIMRKAFTISQAEQVLRDTKAAGIAVKLFILVGHPGETEDDYRKTCDFVTRNADCIDMMGVSILGIEKGSHLERNPDLYGVTMGASRGWRSADGSNTSTIRAERLIAFRHFAKLLGFREEPRSQMLVRDAARFPWLTAKFCTT